MTFVSILYGLLFWIATLILVIGVGRKIYQYSKVPAPLKIPTTPAPITRGGVVWRMFREVVFFESLFRSSKFTWIFAMLFHMALWLVLIRHTRYFMDMNAVLLFLQPFGKYASFAMVIGLVGLSARRIFVDRVRYISAPSDHLMLLLLILIGASGMMMTFVQKVDVTQVKAFFQGLMYFDWQPLPADPIVLVHLFLVAFLMIIFPISKLLHAPGVFFSPTRNQRDNPREQRHVSDWALELEKPGKTGKDLS
ncbi:MAG: Sulfite reduction-associated complex DsrMKJOP protein DsrM (= HmeC) [uncultured Thiotrichaceae bacterium]|uniref:Sulfite reduction-associated complex DsrMKJOP protein DsrM (= HmeC) n=1 Tax=uncultured Thiotrichaceae bacterium TaxID=298394 RepID=A0A6S6TD40_9GAMM|nr:MAG: Sulfite reduction-associated complex DsrMKJOP protein DsrM (= HmeC) [uncultured Thiotrichaceae bacterium]